MQTPLLATFFLDTFALLPLCAVIAVWLSFKLAKKYETRLYWIYCFYVLTMIGFWLVAGGFWFNWLQISNLPLIGWWFEQFGDARSFMVNFEWRLLFGKDLVDQQELANAGFWGKWNLIAMFYFLVVYPLSLFLSIVTRLILFGRSEKQTGVFGLIPIPFLKDRRR